MNKLILTTALGLALFAVPAVAPAVAQDRSGTVPGTGATDRTGTGSGIGSGTGAGSIGGPSDRARPETERSRSLDKQRSTSPMITDPRLGPSGSGGTGSGTSVPGGSGGAGR